MASKDRPQPIWDHREIYIPDEIVVPLVDPEMTPTISLSQLSGPALRDPILEIVAGIEDPEQIVQKKTRQSLHQRGRDGHLRVNRFNDRNSRRTLGEKEEVIRTSEYKVSRRLFAFEEAMEQVSEPIVEAKDQSGSEEIIIQAGSSGELPVSKGSWTFIDESPPNPVKINSASIDPVGSYQSILSEVADPDTVELFVEDQLRVKGTHDGPEPTTIRSPLFTPPHRNMTPVSDSFDPESRP